MNLKWMYDPDIALIASNLALFFVLMFLAFAKMGYL